MTQESKDGRKLIVGRRLRWEEDRAKDAHDGGLWARETDVPERPRIGVLSCAILGPIDARP